MKIKIAPSILAADFTSLGDELKSIAKEDIDFFHIDIMDGHFVPNITIGPGVVKSLRGITSKDFEAHLMISEPLKYVDSFANAGANIITVHSETISVVDYKSLSQKLRGRRIKIAVALNPETPVRAIYDFIEYSDMLLVMSVHPGFGGQKFIPEVLPKITELRGRYQGDIAVDGGINDVTGKLAVSAGANVLAAGTYLFKATDKTRAIARLKNV